MGKKKKGGKRCLALVVVLMLMLCGLAYAEQTGTTFWHSHSYVDSKDAGWQDKYSELQKKQNMPLGVGVDAIIYEFDGALMDYGMQTINTEYKYDIANDNHSVYGVIHVNLWQTGKKLLGK